ncbi:helix-turn-helix transcriptional regulator [Iamia sp.]|uniref:helix-turn-helix domain-containing protein n=1 Tax=Iamia sp. TaxID=2722710 RepID=UPI002CA163C8|nr:helix-turn-helix transcriptional regulator [Iamia sp.]HXH59114.1 helix-turn-helix transcriptional regulator [Iamia sp.]
MITNERQYQQTRRKLAELERLIASTESGEAGDEGFRDLQVAGLQSQAADLREELGEYEKLRDGATTVIEASSLAGLGDALIKARVARGWTQRQLADRLGVAEQQIQRYESTAYRSASLARLSDIADALGVSFSERAELRTTSGNVA